MTARLKPLRRALLPVVIVAAVTAVHYVWLGVFPEVDPAQSRWAAVETAAEASWLRRYVDTASYWLGFSYALSLAFAEAQLRRYREERLCGARSLAIGGVSFSGFLAVAACYLVGCCGSPMLAVYLSLLGAAFLPFAKPLVFVVTVTSLSAGWLWIERSRRRAAAVAEACVCAGVCAPVASSSAPESQHAGK